MSVSKLVLFDTSPHFQKRPSPHKQSIYISLAVTTGNGASFSSLIIYKTINPLQIIVNAFYIHIVSYIYFTKQIEQTDSYSISKQFEASFSLFLRPANETSCKHNFVCRAFATNKAVHINHVPLSYSLNY